MKVKQETYIDAFVHGINKEAEAMGIDKDFMLGFWHEWDKIGFEILDEAAKHDGPELYDKLAAYALQPAGEDAELLVKAADQVASIEPQQNLATPLSLPKSIEEFKQMMTQPGQGVSRVGAGALAGMLGGAGLGAMGNHPLLGALLGILAGGGLSYLLPALMPKLRSLWAHLKGTDPAAAAKIEEVVPQVAGPSDSPAQAAATNKVLAKDPNVVPGVNATPGSAASQGRPTDPSESNAPMPGDFVPEEGGESVVKAPDASLIKQPVVGQQPLVPKTVDPNISQAANQVTNTVQSAKVPSLFQSTGRANLENADWGNAPSVTTADGAEVKYRPNPAFLPTNSAPTEAPAQPSAIGRLAKSIPALVTRPVKALANQAVNVAGAGGEAASRIGTSVLDAGNRVIGNAATDINTEADRLANSVNQAGQNAVDKVNTLAEGGQTQLNNLANNVVAGANNMASKINATGNAASQGLASAGAGLTSKVKGVGNAIGDKLDTVGVRIPPPAIAGK